MVVDAVAAVLRGEYEVENHYRGRHLAKTMVNDVAHPSHKRTASTTGSLVFMVAVAGAKAGRTATGQLRHRAILSGFRRTRHQCCPAYTRPNCRYSGDP